MVARPRRSVLYMPGSNAKALAKARTLWCPIDAETGKPASVSPEVRASFSVDASLE